MCDFAFHVFAGAMAAIFLAKYLNTLYVSSVTILKRKIAGMTDISKLTD